MTSIPPTSDTPAPAVAESPVRRWRPQAQAQAPAGDVHKVPEIGGRKDGTDPTRYGDWEKNGRCIDF